MLIINIDSYYICGCTDFVDYSVEMKDNLTTMFNTFDKKIAVDIIKREFAKDIVQISIKMVVV